MNKFFEFTEPYTAVVAAPDADTAIRVYHDEVCDPCEEETAPKELTEQEAQAAWDARGNPEESPEGIEVHKNNANAHAILIDGNLM